MNLTQAFKIAVKSIAAKKARSALTMLGVIIGLAAVIILVSYAEGQNRQMREYYESLGNNVVNINAYSPSGRDLTKTIRDYCMEDLDDYILGLTPTVDYYDQTILKYGAKSMDSHNSNWTNPPSSSWQPGLLPLQQLHHRPGPGHLLPGRGKLQPGLCPRLQNRRHPLQLH